MVPQGCGDPLTPLPRLYLFTPQGLQVSADANVKGSYLLQGVLGDNYTEF